MTEVGTDPEPQRYLGYLLRRAQQRHAAVWARVVSTETTSVQYSVLAVLKRLTAASQRELCEAVDLDRSTIADLVARMQRRGLVSRRRAVDDGRRNDVALTDLGHAEHDRLQPRVEAVQRELTAPLTDAQVRALREALQSLLTTESLAGS